MSIKQIMTNIITIDTIRMYGGPETLEIKADQHRSDFIHVRLGDHQVAVQTKDLYNAVVSCRASMRIPRDRWPS